MSQKNNLGKSRAIVNHKLPNTELTRHDFPMFEFSYTVPSSFTREEYLSVSNFGNKFEFELRHQLKTNGLLVDDMATTRAMLGLVELQAVWDQFVMNNDKLKPGSIATAEYHMLVDRNVGNARGLYRVINLSTNKRADINPGVYSFTRPTWEEFKLLIHTLLTNNN